MPVPVEAVEVANQGITVLERLIALGTTGLAMFGWISEKVARYQDGKSYRDVIEKKDAALDAVNAWVRGAFDEMRRRRENGSGG